MTTLLQQAFNEAAKLSIAEQDLLAIWLLSELSSEDNIDRAIDHTSEKLAGLANEALAEYRAGISRELDPDQL